MEPRVLRFFTEQHFKLSKSGQNMPARLAKIPDDQVFQEDGLSLKPQPRPCLDCGDMVEDRRVTYSLKYYQNDKRAWIRKCTGCGVKTPVSKPFDNC